MSELIVVGGTVDVGRDAVAPDPVTMLALGFLAQYSGRTLEAYRQDLRSYAAWCASHDVEILDVTRPQLQLWIRELEEHGLAPATIGRRLSAVSGFYGYAVAEDALGRSPAAHIRRPKVSSESTRLGLSREELLRLLDAAAADGPVAFALVCLLALSGLRVSEACAIRIEDLHDVRGHQALDVVRKGGKRQTVAIATTTAAALGRLTAAAQPGRPLLGLDRYQAWRIVRRCVDAARISKRISPHSLRHTMVTLMLEAGVPLHRVQDAAGHADPRTTRRYDRARNNLEGHGTYTLDDFLHRPDDPGRAHVPD